MLGAVILIEMRGRIAPLDDEWYATYFLAAAVDDEPPLMPRMGKEMEDAGELEVEQLDVVLSVLEEVLVGWKEFCYPRQWPPLQQLRRRGCDVKMRPLLGGERLQHVPN